LVHVYDVVFGLVEVNDDGSDLENVHASHHHLDYLVEDPIPFLLEGHAL
jgi:hypothetical protein